MKFSCTQAARCAFTPRSKSRTSASARKACGFVDRRRGGLTVAARLANVVLGRLRIATAARIATARILPTASARCVSAVAACGSISRGHSLQLAPLLREHRRARARCPASSTSQCVTKRTEYDAVSCAQRPRLYRDVAPLDGVLAGLRAIKNHDVGLHRCGSIVEPRNLRDAFRRGACAFLWSICSATEIFPVRSILRRR